MTYPCIRHLYVVLLFIATVLSVTYCEVKIERFVPRSLSLTSSGAAMGSVRLLIDGNTKLGLPESIQFRDTKLTKHGKLRTLKLKPIPYTIGTSVDYTEVGTSSSAIAVTFYHSASKSMFLNLARPIAVAIAPDRKAVSELFDGVDKAIKSKISYTDSLFLFYDANTDSMYLEHVDKKNRDNRIDKEGVYAMKNPILVKEKCLGFCTHFMEMMVKRIEKETK